MTPRHAQATVGRLGAHTEPRDLRGNQAFDRSTARRTDSATCLDVAVDLWMCHPRVAERGRARSRIGCRRPVLGLLWLTNGPRPVPRSPVRMWLKRGLRCRKLHCPPRQVDLVARRLLVSDDVMIAV